MGVKTVAVGRRLNSTEGDFKAFLISGDELNKLICRINVVVGIQICLVLIPALGKAENQVVSV